MPAYKLHDRIEYQGIPISIENARGSVRRGKDKDGHEWATFMHFMYGYVKGTKGVDGDAIDVYIGNNPNSKLIFIIHQQDPITKKYDEDKCFLGFNTAKEAKRAYLRQYDRPGFYQGMTVVSISKFKEIIEKRGIKLTDDKNDYCKKLHQLQIRRGELPINSDQVLKEKLVIKLQKD